MFVKVSDTRIIPTANIVDINISPARKERPATEEEIASYDYREGAVLTARPLSVEITTTAITSRYDDGGDYPHTARVETFPYTIRLYGEEAELFLDALPTYEPVLEAGIPDREER